MKSHYNARIITQRPGCHAADMRQANLSIGHVTSNLISEVTQVSLLISAGTMFCASIPHCFASYPHPWLLSLPLHDALVPTDYILEVQMLEYVLSQIK